MTESFHQMILNRSIPMEPIATAEKPRLKKLTGIRVVLFDIYGTLLVSGCGDIGTTREMNKTHSHDRDFMTALAENGIACDGIGSQGVQCIRDEIASSQQRSRVLGIEFPEVDIVDVWGRTIKRMEQSGLLSVSAPLTPRDLQRIALTYELVTNPVWPMPDARSCLSDLSRAELQLGLISNAQWLTIEIWQVLLQADNSDFSIDADLQFYSYQHGEAKPGLKLFELATEALSRSRIAPDEVLFIGNDVLNDMMPAQKVGFRTALFAGDARSLRKRRNDPRVFGVEPDIVLCDLSDLPSCLN